MQVDRRELGKIMHDSILEKQGCLSLVPQASGAQL